MIFSLSVHLETDENGIMDVATDDSLLSVVVCKVVRFTQWLEQHKLGHLCEFYLFLCALPLWDGPSTVSPKIWHYYTKSFKHGRFDYYGILFLVGIKPYPLEVLQETLKFSHCPASFGGYFVYYYLISCPFIWSSLVAKTGIFRWLISCT